MQGPKAVENLLLVGTSLLLEVGKKTDDDDDDDDDNSANNLLLLLYSHLLRSRKHTVCV
jgi:hypothetical protein